MPVTRDASSPKDPSEDHDHTEQEPNDEPPGIPPRSIFAREVVAALRTAFGVLIDRSAAIGAWDRLVEVTVPRLVRILGIVELVVVIEVAHSSPKPHERKS
jgi:hypothetical protein